MKGLRFSTERVSSLPLTPPHPPPMLGFSTNSRHLKIHARQYRFLLKLVRIYLLSTESLAHQSRYPNNDTSAYNGCIENDTVSPNAIRSYVHEMKHEEQEFQVDLHVSKCLYLGICALF